MEAYSGAFNEARKGWAIYGRGIPEVISVRKRGIIIISILTAIILTSVYFGVRAYRSISAIVRVSDKSLNGLTREERLEDFDYMYSILKDNFPYFEVEKRKMGYDWLLRREEFRERIKNVQDDGEFYKEMVKILKLLQNGHTNMISPSNFKDYRQLYKGLSNKPWRDVLNNEGSTRKYNYWEDKIKDSASVLPLNIINVEGNYVLVEDSMKSLERYEIDEFSVLKKVGKQTIDNYINSLMNTKTSIYDSKRKKLKFTKLVIPCNVGKSLELTLETPDGRTIKRVIDGEELQLRSVSSGGQDSVYAAGILKQREIAYLKVSSFSGFYTEKDREGIYDFLKSIKDYKNLIIDIRGNGGGDTNYWEKNIVSPLINSSLSSDFYYAFRGGEYIRPFIRARGMAQRPIENIPEKPGYPSELKTDFKTFFHSRNIIEPLNPVGFRGKIYLLVDENVYSSAEAFAAFAKASGWATIIGTETGGDGIGIDPALCALPNSGLIFRFPLEMGLNPDGTSNEEFHTVPDIYVEQTCSDFGNYIEFQRSNPKEIINPYDTVMNRMLGILQ